MPAPGEPTEWQAESTRESEPLPPDELPPLVPEDPLLDPPFELPPDEALFFLAAAAAAAFC